jgi:hypothetical protein
VLTAVGVALLWVPGAGAALTIGGTEIVSASVVAATGSIGTWIGAGATVVGIVLDGAQVHTTPSKFIGWYGGHDYSCVVDGGFEFTLSDNPTPPPDKVTTVKDLKPIGLYWTNVDSGENGYAKPNW